MHFEGKNVILFLLEQGAIGCSGRHWAKSRGLTPMGFKRVTKKGRAVIILFDSFFFLITLFKTNVGHIKKDLLYIPNGWDPFPL